MPKDKEDITGKYRKLTDARPASRRLLKIQQGTTPAGNASLGNQSSKKKKPGKKKPRKKNKE